MHVCETDTSISVKTEIILFLQHRRYSMSIEIAFDVLNKLGRRVNIACSVVTRHNSRSGLGAKYSTPMDRRASCCKKSAADVVINFPDL
jgi:hypothetical protein